MSHKLISHSLDLKKLRDEGYEVEIRGSYLLVGHVPYVAANREVKYGTLVSTLSLSSPEQTARPDNHVIHFVGEHPCNHDGTRMNGILLNSGNQVLDAAYNIVSNYSFSNKPPNGYDNYYEKVTSYIRVISSQAEAIDPNVTAKTFKVIESADVETVFRYVDTNSSRAEINVVSAKLATQKIAIVGLGGTGSYVLDFLAKTPVKEIHLFDGDLFLQHNAFRAPGAPSVEELSARQRKVNYLCGIYSKMHKFVIPHECHLDEASLHALDGISFVFICIDNGEAKRTIVTKLLQQHIPFIDVGIGVEVIEGALSGSVRVTTVTDIKNDHIRDHISFSDDENGAYTQNIQIAELNALNAALAVIKWKKLRSFYHDLEKEHNGTYEININKMINDAAIT